MTASRTENLISSQRRYSQSGSAPSAAPVGRSSISVAVMRCRASASMRARARADMPSGGGPPPAALATSGVSSLVSSVPVGIVSSMVSAPWGAGSLRIASIAGPQARVVSLVSGWTGTLQDVKSRT